MRLWVAVFLLSFELVFGAPPPPNPYPNPPPPAPAMPKFNVTVPNATPEEEHKPVIIPPLKPPVLVPFPKILQFKAIARPPAEERLKLPKIFETDRDKHFRIIENSAQYRGRKEVPLFNDQTLALDTATHEMENDALVARYQHESNTAWAEFTEKLYNQQLELRDRGIVSLLEYEEHRMLLRRSRAKVDESRHRILELETQVHLMKLGKAALTGAHVPLEQTAQGLADLWLARLEQAKAAREFAKAEYDFAHLALEITEKLRARRTSSPEELYKKQRREKETSALIRLGDKLVEQNEVFYAEALENLKKAKGH